MKMVERDPKSIGCQVENEPLNEIPAAKLKNGSPQFLCSLLLQDINFLCRHLPIRVTDKVNTSAAAAL